MISCRQIELVVRKASNILALIVKELDLKNSEALVQLYRTLVRPHLEYCAQFWSSYPKDKVTLEAVQRMIARLISWMRVLSDQEGLNSLGLYSMFIAMWSDIIQTNKILRRHSKVDVKMFSTVEESHTRELGYKLRSQSFKTEAYSNFFSLEFSVTEGGQCQIIGYF